MKHHSNRASFLQIKLISAAIVFLCFFNTRSDAQTSAPTGIFQDTVYSSVKFTSNIVYGSNYNPFYDAFDTLKLDMYEPDSTIDYKRPVIIYVHGGGFMGGDKLGDKATVFGNYFAKCGYLYASINYRLFIDDPNDTIDNYEGVYMGTEDAKSAVRFFREHASEYCVDSSMIFMIGTSAGAALCLSAAYWDQSEADLIFDTTPFGPLDNSSGNEGFSSKPRAIISCWGGITDTAWLRHETIPNQLFHGTNDSTVPFFWGLGKSGVHLFGSWTIHQASVRNQVESHLHPIIGAGHGVSSDSPEFDTILQISTGFLYDHLKIGTGFTPCSITSVGNTLTSGDISVSTINGDHLVIQNNREIGLSGSLRIYSMSGNLVRTSNVSIATGGNLQVDCSSLASGCYLAQILGGNINHVSKILIKM